MDQTINIIGQIYTLSAPFYFILALTIPVLLVYIVVKTLLVYKIMGSSLYKKRLLAMSMTCISSILYVETHFIGSILNLDYIPYGIDNLFAIGIFISAYVAVESFISIAMRYIPADLKRYDAQKKILKALLIFCVTMLGVGSLFLGYPIYDTFVTFFGLGFIPFVILLFYSLYSARKKGDITSKRQIFWLYIMIIVFGSAGFVDTIFDILNIPVFLNVLYIPASIIALYSVYKISNNFIETEKEEM